MQIHLVLYRIYTLAIRTTLLPFFRGGLGRIKRCQIVLINLTYPKTQLYFCEYRRLNVSAWSDWSFSFFFCLSFLQDCSFTKNFPDTSLHVYWTGDFRLRNCNNCCKRWYFTFNGTECSGPLPIDGILYMWKGSGTLNPHRVRHIEGHCNNIHRGKVQVGFWVGNCTGYSGSYDAYTGYISVSRIFIEEVSKPQA